jgi:WD40 repeat protein
MKLPKRVITRAFLQLNYARLALAAFSALTLIVPVDGQRTYHPRPPTGFDDVVFAVSFSPDGGTLAIARGAGEPSQRFGRIELWDTKTGTLRHVIKGFDGPVGSLSFSPDGQTLVSSSSEFHSSKIQEKARSREGSVLGEVKWWDAQTGELKQRLALPGEGSFSLRATYSPDGKQLAVVESFRQFSYLLAGPNFTSPALGSASETFPTPVASPMMMIFRTDLKLLDAQTGESKLKLNTDQARGALFSPDGTLLVVENGNEIRIWNSHTGEEVRKLKDFKGRPNAMAFSPDGQTLAVAITKYEHQSSRRFTMVIGKSEVRLFDLRTWNVSLRLQNLGAVNSLAFEPGGKWLLMGGMLSDRDSTMPAIKVWNLQTGGVAANFPTGGEGFSEAVDSLVLSRNGRWLAFQSGPATVKMLDTQTWKVKETWDATSIGAAVERPTSRFLLSVKRVLAIAFSVDGKTLSGETDQGEIRLWDPRTGEVKNKPVTGDNDPSLVAVSSNGKSFAEVSNGKVLLWNAGSGDKRTVLAAGRRPTSAVALSADGKTLAIAGSKDVMLLSPTGTMTKTLTGQHGSVSRISFSDDGRTLASADEEGMIEIWNVANSRIEKTITAGTGITALRLAPNGQILATASEDRVVTVWNLQTGLALRKLQKHDAPINALAFSSDSQLLASGGDDRTVVIWETASGKAKRTLKGHDQTVTSLAFSPDGRLLASGSGNASVVLWEVRTGKLNRVLR